MEKSKTDLRFLTDACAGDKTTIAEMIRGFLVQKNEFTSSVKNLLHKKDYDTLRKTVHKMKSAVKIVGMELTYTYLQELETLIVNATHNLSSISNLISVVLSHLDDSEKELQSELQRLID